MMNGTLQYHNRGQSSFRCDFRYRDIPVLLLLFAKVVCNPRGLCSIIQLCNSQSSCKIRNLGPQRTSPSLSPRRRRPRFFTSTILDLFHCLSIGVGDDLRLRRFCALLSAWTRKTRVPSQRYHSLSIFDRLPTRSAITVN